MTQDEKIEEIKQFFDEKILGFMSTDLKRSVEANTNFLTALGCLTYTEVIGLFLPPIEGETGAQKARKFYRCLFRFQSEQYLRLLDAEVRRETGKQNGLYEHLRHSASHAYEPGIKRYNSKDKTFSFVHVKIAKVAKEKDGSLGPPMGLDRDGDFVIGTKNYVLELEKAAKDFRKRICLDQEKTWVESGTKGIDFIRRGIGR